MSLRKLTLDEIKPLAAKKGVRKVAVENFLMTVDANPDSGCANVNLSADARAYGWNAATQSAIRKGIELASKPAKS